MNLLGIDLRKICRVLPGLGFLLLFGCASDTRASRHLLDQANEMVQQDKPDEGRKMLQQVVAEYPGTTEAAEATHLLTLLADRAGPRNVDSLRHELLVQVGRFTLDCGRYPTEREGLHALLVNPGLDGWRGPYLDKQWAARIADFDYRLRNDKPEITVRGK